MDSSSDGFLAAAPGSPETPENGSTTALGPHTNDKDEHGDGAWLRTFSADVCSAKDRLDDIPKPVMDFYGACMRSSGFGTALPLAIAKGRRNEVERFQASVLAMQRAAGPETSSSDGTGLSVSAPPQREAGSTAHEGLSQNYVQAYFTSISLSLLPLLCALVVVLVALLVVLLLSCIQKTRCGRSRLRSSCCLWLFFKPKEEAQRQPKKRSLSEFSEDSTPSMYSTLDRERGRSAKMLMLRASWFGLRYIWLVLLCLILVLGLSLGIVALIELDTTLNRLSCQSGRAASTVIDGQVIASAEEDPALFQASPFASPLVDVPSAKTQQHAALQSDSSRLLAKGGVPAEAESQGNSPLGAQRSVDDGDEESVFDPPKRRGFWGLSRAIDHVDSVLMAFGTAGPHSIPAAVLRSRNSGATIQDALARFAKITKILHEVLEHPANRGSSLRYDQGGTATSSLGSATYHVALVAALQQPVVGTCDLLPILVGEGVDMIVNATNQVLQEVQDQKQKGFGLEQHTEDLHHARQVVSATLAHVRTVAEPLYSVRNILFWVTIVGFVVLILVVLFAAVFLLLLCSCKRRSTVKRPGIVCGWTAGMLVVAAAALIWSGLLVALSIVLTDACIYSESYLKRAEDIENLKQHFSGDAAGRSAVAEPSTPAKVLAACFLPNQNRDLMQVLELSEIGDLSDEFRVQSRASGRAETSAAMFIALQMRQASGELQRLRKVVGVYVVDRFAVSKHRLDGRMSTPHEVLFSGLERHRRSISIESLNSGVYEEATPSAAAQASQTSGGTVQQLKRQPWDQQFAQHKKPADMLTSYLKEGSKNEDSDAIVKQLQDEFSVLRLSMSSGSPKLPDNNVVQKVIKLTDGRPESERAHVLHTVVTLASQASAGQDRASLGLAGRQPKSDNLLHAIWERLGRPESLTIYGLGDVERCIAPFYLSSLHRDDDRSTQASDPQYRIHASFDPQAPQVLDQAARQPTAADRQYFLNAVWWAVQKERLRSEASTAFRCPAPADAPNNSVLVPCNLSTLTQSTLRLVDDAETALKEVWTELRVFFEDRAALYDYMRNTSAVGPQNLDCGVVYSEVQPLKELVCEDARFGMTHVAMLLLVLAGAAIVLLPGFFCLWSAAVENRCREQNAARASIRKRSSRK